MVSLLRMARGLRSVWRWAAGVFLLTAAGLGSVSASSTKLANRDVRYGMVPISKENSAEEYLTAFRTA